MGSSKRFQLSVLCLTVVALLAATPAFAAKGTATLTPCGDEPAASGKLTLTQGFVWTTYEWYGQPYKQAAINYTMACTGLTPGEYYSGFGGGIADKNGKLVAKGWYLVDEGWRPTDVWVYRLVDVWDPTYGWTPAWQLVLYGKIVWSGNP